MDDSDSDSNAPSPYMASLFKGAPKSRRAVTINTDNPLNTATAYPSRYVGIDAKETPPEGKFPMTTQHSYMDSSSLVASALKPGSVAARKAKQQLQKDKGKATPKAYNLGINMAPGRATPLTEYEIDNSPSVPRQGKDAATSKKGKGKRKFEADFGEEDDEAEEATPVQRKKAKRASNSGVTNQQSAKASSKLLHSVDNIFKMDNNDPYYKLPDTPEQALAADRMLMKWKAERRRWAEIVPEWTRISGQPTDESNLSTRHLLIQEKYANSSKEFDEPILKAKKIAAKQSGGDLWDRVSSVLKEDYDMYLRPSVCRRRFQMMEIERKEAEAREESEKDYKEAKEALPTEIEEPYLGVQEKGPSSYFSVTGEEYLEDRRSDAQIQPEDDVSEDELS